MIKWDKEPEMAEFMKEIIPGHHESEIRAMFLERFGICLTKSQIKGVKHKYNINSGTVGARFEKGQEPWNKGKPLTKEQYERFSKTMFKKGHMPHNWHPVGSERIDSTGYIMVKVAEPRTWRMKQRIVWEEHYGVKLKSDELIMFLDGNKKNVNIENLIMLTRAELIRYNQSNLRTDDSELNRTAALLAKLKTKQFEQRRKKNERYKKADTDD